MQYQPVRCCQQHLEKYKQVEQIAGQECAVQPHQQQLEQRMEMRTRFVPACQRKTQCRQSENAGQQHHHCRETIQHQHNRIGCRPVTQQIRKHTVVRRIGHIDQHDRHNKQHKSRCNADCSLQHTATLIIEQQQSCGDERQQNRRDNQMFLPILHYWLSLPSTWSVPVRPREASMTTRNRAVMAKPITIAVSTSACGNGSV